MPNGNINSDALDSLFDPKGNVVLEQFEDSAYGTTAVLLRPESAAYRAQTGLGDPYVVAYGYDKNSSSDTSTTYTLAMPTSFSARSAELPNPREVSPFLLVDNTTKGSSRSVSVSSRVNSLRSFFWSSFTSLSMTSMLPTHIRIPGSFMKYFTILGTLANGNSTSPKNEVLRPEVTHDLPMAIVQAL